MNTSNLTIHPQYRDSHRILIIGGGAGGLELATRLANTVGRRGLSEVTLVDRYPTHFWKPLLHEAASGHRDPASHHIEYAALAKRNGFHFVQGELEDIDRSECLATVGGISDHDGNDILPRRVLRYDSLVLAVGSVTNFFNVPGAERYALPLENVEHAEKFRRKLLAACTKANHFREAGATLPASTIHVSVIGAGATGVELSAALRNAINLLSAYHLESLDPQRDVRVRLIEGGSRILPALDERVSMRTHARLTHLGVEILTSTPVSEVRADSVVTGNGERLASDITVWAAGVAGPPILQAVDGIALSRLGQVLVGETLQTPDDPRILAFGDCAACPSSIEGAFLPPRAQVAHQQAVYLSRSFLERLSGKTVTRFTFRDAGTVVSLGPAGAVYQGDLGFRSRSLVVGGRSAKALYAFVYRRHLFALAGLARAATETVSQWLRSRIRPAIKLH
ncbi:NAD(P)/FAD-dependent oxidoreductase [Paraburkholderia hospita]|uniref:NAD(P)/FAD-dependent oxidoreductase n=1 Tax=Paraburkholderia hospita TaxID=169430 RepID=UPI000DEEDB1D|nr:NAD(P)/FAD-dependent oxidoreductase [Paraburkholderia hospita]AXF06288.1 FAD-dependent oxidoreductase [Paraburkholderia hospita]